MPTVGRAHLPGGAQPEPALTTTGDISIGGPVAPLTLVCEDGFPLAARRWRGLGTPRGVVLIAPATGVRQRYYAPFAAFLASRGFDVLTWDWRGIAESRHDAPWRDHRLTMRAWGERDLTAAIGWADRRAAGLPVLLVGHSFGGQALGLARNGDRVTRAVLVGAQHPWCGHWPLRLRWQLRLLWHILMPATAHVLGRFPSSRVGLGEDLPRGVALEWARWGRRPTALGDGAGHAVLTLPLLAFSLADDRVAPRRAVEALLAAYRGAAVTHRHVVPESVGRAAIGHFGFFREGTVPGLWKDAAAFLEEE